MHPDHQSLLHPEHPIELLSLPLTIRGRRATAVVGAPLLCFATACAPGGSSGPVDLRVDLRQPQDGTLSVTLEVGARAGERLTLSSFVQPEAIGLLSIRAEQGSTPLEVESGRDERGFGRFVVAPAGKTGPVRIEYRLRPGAAEEMPMSGPSGYRFGHLDGGFALLGGRQVALLPADPAPPKALRLRFLLPEGLRLLAPWEAAGEQEGVVLQGPGAAARLLSGIFALGEFETAAAGTFRVSALRRLPDAQRRSALARALEIEAYLAERLGPPTRFFHLILAPKAEDGSLISVPPGPDAAAMSIGEGLPTRWLSIARAIGRGCLAGRLAALRPGDPSRPILEALPVFFGLDLSERQGWRRRRLWLESFYDETAGLDLAGPEPITDPIKLEWRTALALDHLTRAMQRAGAGSVDELSRRSLGAGRWLYWRGFVERDLPPEVARDLERWLGPAPRSIPFPGSEIDRPAIILKLPAPIGATAAKGSLDLYLGGRNLGLLEQCGCRSRQAGGLARRATVLRRRLRRDRRAFAVELGDAVPFDQNSPLLDRQKEIESDLSLALLAAGGTAASVVGHAELHYGPGFLRRRLDRLPRGFRLLAANLRAPGLDLPGFIDLPGGAPVRILGLLDDASYHLGRPLEYEDARAALPLLDPVQALAPSLGGAEAGRLTIVAGSLSPSTVLALHEAYPGIGMIVTDDYFHFNEDPRLRFERPATLASFGMLDRTLLVLLKTDSYALARVGLALGGRGEIRGADLEEIVLDESIPDDPGVRARLDRHYAQLARASGLAEAPPIGTALRERLRAEYVAAPACVSCHPAASAQWRETPHASAFATLLDHRRQGVPGCFACHVTGYRQPSGYRAMADRRLRDVQCEACHGPGSRHARDPRPGSIVRTPSAATCRECHTETHSDMTDANFAAYWSRVIHPASPAGGRAADPVDATATTR